MTLDRSNFSSSVEAVLQDAVALQTFREWIRMDNSRAADCVALHFAIKGFQTYVAKNDPNTASMACTLHRKFISTRTGTCSFLPLSVRKEMSLRVHSLNSQHPPYAELFDPVLPALRKQLNILHSQFVTSHSFLAFLAENGSEGSSVGTPSGEGHHALSSSYVVPTTTLLREPNRKVRGSKIRAYSCDASTSKDTEHSSRPIDVDRERNIFKNTDGSVRHDLPEAREAFVAVLCDRLEVISKELERCDKNTYARDLPKDLAACCLLPSLHDNRILEETTSDEEVEKYVGKIDATRRRSEPSSPIPFAFQKSKTDPYESGFAPPPLETKPQFPNISTPSTFTTITRSMEYRFSDSSGFCSSESAYLSDKNFGKKKLSFDFHLRQLGTNSLTRRHHSSFPSHNVFGTLQARNTVPTLTLVLRENGEPPMVAKIHPDLITLAKFRRTFGISRTENRRFLFKSMCEDGTAPYQWSLITDDDAVLPLFEGRITAECRYLTEVD